MSHAQTVTKKPWYKNFWLLFLLVFPAASIVMGSITLYLAISRPVSVVQDNYYKEGLAINQQMQAIENARKQNIELELMFSKGLVTLNSNQNLPETTAHLRLYFAHNLNDKLDREVIANRTGEKSFASTMADLKPGLWYVSVSPAHKQSLWRIKGKINNQGQQKFLLNAKMR